MPARTRSQLAIQAPPELLERLRAAAAAQGRTTTSMVLQWIEVGLAEAPAPAADAELLARIEALEAAVGALQQARRPDAPPAPAGPAPAPAAAPPAAPLAAPAGALTTAELADRTGTSRAAWNNWANKNPVGAIREHPTAGSWRLAGKASPAAGGPARWLWESAA